MTLLDGIVLGLVQGLTEFLPVSSTGHLIIVRELLGLTGDGGLAFDAALHVATLVAVLAYFRREVRELVTSGVRWIMRRPLAEHEATLLGAVAWGTVPAVAVGLLMRDVIETSARSSVMVAVGLLAGSVLMWYADKKSHEHRLVGTLSARTGFRIGLFQVMALFPGMSRSGSTISGGLLNGLSREEATRFAFVLSFPVLVAAGGASLASLIANPTDVGSLTPLIGGLVAALVSGLGAIHFLIRYLKTHSLSVFVWYRVALACLILVWMI